MRKVGVTIALLLACVLAAIASARGGSGAAAETGVVASVYDGDTLTLADGRRVRLLQIDTPELGSGECYSRAARTALVTLAPPGARVTLTLDPALDRVDRYGRILRYVGRGATNVNLELVRRGAAAPYFYRGERGRYAAALLRAATTARTGKRGLWKACPSTALDPTSAVETGRSGPPPKAAPATGKCDPNYTGGCVPPYPPDVDCADIRALGIARSKSSAPTRTGSTATTTASAASSYGRSGGTGGRSTGSSSTTGGGSTGSSGSDSTSVSTA